MNNNNPFTEIGLIILSVAILAAMTVLLATSKINYVEALNFLIVVAGLFGVNVAAKAPSPAQQQQLQQLTSQALSVLPNVVAATQQPAPPQGGSVIAPATQPINPLVPPPVNATAMQAPLNTTTSVQSPLAAFSTGLTGQMPAIVPPETK